MKRFNITKSTPVIFGKRLPSMCVYGTFPLIYYTSFKVYDKNGRAHKKRKKHVREITYCITDYKYAPVGKPAYYFECYNEKNDRWECHNTAERRIYQQLFDFVDPLIDRNDLYDVVPEYPMPRNVCPQPKKAQVWADSMLEYGGIGYVLNTHVMTDDVIKKQFVDSYSKK